MSAVQFHRDGRFRARLPVTPRQFQKLGQGPMRLKPVRRNTDRVAQRILHPIPIVPQRSDRRQVIPGVLPILGGPRSTNRRIGSLLRGRGAFRQAYGRARQTSHRPRIIQIPIPS